MAFIDPIDLLKIDIPADGVLPPEDIRRAKRRILAEFELSGKITIPYQGQEIDKSIALTAVDQLEDPRLQPHFVALHRQPDLIAFMRSPDLRPLMKVPAAEKLGGPTFIKFISERLAPVYSDLLATHIRKSDWKSAGLLLNRLDLIDTWEHDTALKPVVNHIRLQLRLLTDLADATHQNIDQLWDPKIVNAHMLEAMNRLPKAYIEQRNQYAKQLANVAIQLTSELNKSDLGLYVIQGAAKLDLDTAASDRVMQVQAWVWQRNKIKQAAEQARTTTSTSTQQEQKKATNPAGCVVAAILIIAALVGLFRSAGHRSMDISDYPTLNIPYTPPDFGNISSFNADSITSALAKLGSITSSTSRASDIRYDTIFFRDLLLYEGLNKTAGKIDPSEGNPMNPEKGEPIYKRLIRPASAPWDTKDDPYPLTLANKSDKDCVFFLESTTGGQILYHYYLHAGDVFRIPDLPVAFYTVRVYYGSNLRTDAATFQGKPLPVFANPGNEIFTANSSDHPTVDMIFHTQQYSYDDSPAPVKMLAFTPQYEIFFAD